MSEDDVIALMTLQFHSGGLFDGEGVDGFRVHLVRATQAGTPGGTLCGIDRFHESTPGWSVGGGVSGPGIEHKPCPGCAVTADEEFPGLPIHGSVGARQMREALGRPHP